MDRLFPLQDIPPPPEIPEVSQEDIEARVKRVQSAMKTVSPRPDAEGIDHEVKRLGSDYRSYKDIDELEGTVRRFYEVVAEAAGLSVRDLLRAVSALEQMLQTWQRSEKRRLRGDSGE